VLNVAWLECPRCLITTIVRAIPRITATPSTIASSARLHVEGNIPSAREIFSDVGAGTTPFRSEPTVLEIHEEYDNTLVYTPEIIACACYALLRMRPLLNSWAECSVVISCGKVDYDKSG
jgi:hypothetical protein